MIISKKDSFNNIIFFPCCQQINYQVLFTAFWFSTFRSWVMSSSFQGLSPSRRFCFISQKTTKGRKQVLICLLSFRVCSGLASSKSIPEGAIATRSNLLLCFSCGFQNSLFYKRLLFIRGHLNKGL